MTTSPRDAFDPGIHVGDVGAGDPVVLLHSSGMSENQWRRTSEMLQRSGARVVTPDLTGHGKSPPWPDGDAFHFTRDVDLVAALLDRLPRAHVVGHSYGGFIALLAALRAPEQVRSLTLYDPVAFGVLEAGSDQAALADVGRLGFAWGTSAEARDAWLRAFVDYWGGDGAWDALRESAREEFRRVGWVSHEGARTLVDDHTSGSAYRALAMPTLLLTGERSPLAARTVVAKLAAVMPDARMETLAGAGHMGPLTHTKELNELLEAHLRGA